MARLLNLIAMTAGGWLGWWLGSFVSLFTAFIVSMVGTGIALWYAQKFTRHWLP